MSALTPEIVAHIRGASDDDIRRDITLQGRLGLLTDGTLSASYAPFDHIQRSAQLVLVGITPGIQQAQNALIAFRQHLLGGASEQAALAAAKVFASFSGPMRSNLVAILDHVGVASYLGLSSAALLWTSSSNAVHFTSALRYPVLVAGANYSGAPSMSRTPSLRRMIEHYLAEEASQLPDAIWVPLGPRTDEGLAHLVSQGRLDSARVLTGLPHPSGANAERIAYFLGRKERSALSAKTNPDALDAAKADVLAKMTTLRNRAASKPAT